MKALFALFFLACTITSCKQVQNDVVSSSRKVGRFTVVVDTITLAFNPTYTIQYNNNIIIRSPDSTFYSFNTNTSCSNKPFDYILNKIHPQYFINSIDTLIAAKGNSYYYLNDTTWLPIKYNTEEPRVYKMYQDDDFIVSGSCCGEFGGSVFFFDKKTRITYSCPATCANSVLKLPNGDYYITSYLGHMGGGGDIMRIKDPRKLSVYPKMPSYYRCNWYDRLEFIYPEKHKLHAEMQGTEPLIQINKKEFLKTLYINDTLYSIYYNSNADTIYLGYVKDKELHKISSLFAVPDFSYPMGDNAIFGNRMFQYGKNLRTYPVILANDNTIKLIAFKKENLIIMN